MLSFEPMFKLDKCISELLDTSDYIHVRHEIVTRVFATAFCLESDILLHTGVSPGPRIASVIDFKRNGLFKAVWPRLMNKL